MRKIPLNSPPVLLHRETRANRETLYLICDLLINRSICVWKRKTTPTEPVQKKIIMESKEACFVLI